MRQIFALKPLTTSLPEPDAKLKVSEPIDGNHLKVIASMRQ
jgi:hypothetical protein